MSPSLIALLSVATFGLFWVGVPRLLLQANRRRLAARCRRERAIALTFDDGPGAALTPRVMERLAAARVPATFFVLGHHLRGREPVLVDLERRGHEVGSHGHLHVHHVWSLPWAGLDDVREGWRLLRRSLPPPRDGVRPFRPAYGKLNLLSLSWVWWRRAPIAMWTHDSQDTRVGRKCSPAEFADTVRRSGGGVVLLHDFDRGDPATADDVLARLDAVLRLREEGFRFVPVGALLDGAAPAPAVATSAGECR